MFAIATSLGAVALAAAQAEKDPLAELYASHAAWAEAAVHIRDHLLAAPRAQGPFIADAWSANVVSRSPASSTVGDGHGVYFYDGPKQRVRTKTVMQLHLFHESGDSMAMDQLIKNVTGLSSNVSIGVGANATCKATPAPYSDQYSLLRMAGVHVGSGSVGGEACELWEANYSSPAATVSMRACIAADGVPREYNVSTGLAYKAASRQSAVFSNVTVGSPDDAEFEPSEACFERYPAPPCESKGTASLELYRVHSAAEPSSLANRNTGDALGDMAFFCDLGMDESGLVTKWSVEANASWGQYAFCLFAGGKNLCFGHTGKHVGREGPMGLGGPVQGQCSENLELGSWFSFPAEGECQEGSLLGTDGCTWTAKSERTVTAKCILEDRGLKDVCAQERGHAPMTLAAEIFKAALASADPAQGGCPDVPTSAPATEASMFVV